MGPFAPSQSQNHHLARLSLDKQENEGHCEQQLCCSAGHENAGQSVKVSEKDSVLRTRGGKCMRLPAQNSTHIC